MKTKHTSSLTFFIAILFSFSLSAQIGGWNPDLEKEANETIKIMVDGKPKLKTFKNKAYGYAVFPRVTKAGIGIGGATGKGIVYKGGTPVSPVTLSQASIGFQLGGQQYMEIIFFENKKSYDHFINGKLKFDAQASAVAVTVGASVDAAYVDGVAVFTMVKGGLMYEASIGGQHFKFKKKK